MELNDSFSAVKEFERRPKVLNFEPSVSREIFQLSGAKNLREMNLKFTNFFIWISFLALLNL